MDLSLTRRLHLSNVMSRIHSIIHGLGSVGVKRRVYNGYERFQFN